MGGASSRSNAAHDSSSNASTLPKAPKTSKTGKRLQKLKSSFKRKTTDRDRTRPFRELIKSWPIGDLNLLAAEFDADLKLLTLQKRCDFTRKTTNSFSDDFQSSSDDLELVFKSSKFKVSRQFVGQRCKNIRIQEDSDIFTLETENFQYFTEKDVETFLFSYIYTENTEKWMNSPETLTKLRAEFGCQRKLQDDMAQMFKNDLKHGDLIITVIEGQEDGEPDSDKKSRKPYEIRTSAKIAASRSRLIRSLLARKSTETSRICFDEHIFPRAFAALFVSFLYTDSLDWSLAPNSEVSVSSLSQAKAITSGKSPDVQLYRALQIIQVARFFGVERMVQACEDVVVKNLSADNVVNVLQWARDNGAKYIGTHAFRLLEQQFNRISTSPSLFELTADEMLELTGSQFVQTTEIELLDACIRWGEHALLRKLEEREPNVVADTCHSISRRGLKQSELSGEELREILKPLTDNIRTEYALPPFHQNLNDAYGRGILERAPLRDDLLCGSSAEINPDAHWLRPEQSSPGPRFYFPYHSTLLKHRSSLEPSGSSEEPSRRLAPDEFQLDFHNLYPQIVVESQFLAAKRRILSRMEEWDVRSLPRSFHRNFALEMITRQTLLEMDIPDECFDCHVSSGKSTPPDILPPNSVIFMGF